MIPSSSSPSSLLEASLPEILLEEVLRFLSYTEQRRLLGLSQTLWHQRKPRWESKLRTLAFQEAEGRRLFQAQPFQSVAQLRPIFSVELSAAVVSLTLDKCVEDGFLHVALIEMQLFPQLQRLRLRSCDDVTDFGLGCISRSAAAASGTLEVIDITFCKNTTYRGTFPLRNQVKSLRVLRRQPEWLDGRFETPFGDAATSSGSGGGGGGGGGEIHTYYCDGSFQFNRDSQSNGFVTHLFPWDDDFLGDKLQYNNFRVPNGWPEWTAFCYRPGVCLLRLPPLSSPSSSSSSSPAEESGAQQVMTTPPSVLVGQYMRGLKAPKNRALMERAKDVVPMGQSRFFDKTTEALLPYHDAAAISDHGVVDLNQVIMISRMRVMPLLIPSSTAPASPQQQQHHHHHHHLMPPASLVQACQNTCQGLQSYTNDFLAMQERNLNQLLSGDDVIYDDDDDDDTG